MLSALVLTALTSCEPDALKEADVFTPESDVESILNDPAINPEGAQLYHLNDFLDTYMTEQGNFWSDTSQYRTRATNGNGLYLYSVDTLPTNGKGIYIMGRVTTDDYSGNFYKSFVIQEIVDDDQQNLRVTIDMGSSHGLYHTGQMILIRVNGLAVGRYANQPQLCVPSYNNNIFAMNASQKVGWAPGRIPAAKFRNAARPIGAPDPSKLMYDTVSLAKLFGNKNVTGEFPFKPKATPEGMDQVRKADGRLIVIKDVFFTGQANDNGALVDCVYGHPDTASLANVFAPSTANIGYPQSRVLKQSTSQEEPSICCSSSEYCKFAYFYLPGAKAASGKAAIQDCPKWKGTVAGILGWYQDNAASLTNEKITGNEWSITPRGIPGIGIPDIKMSYKNPITQKVTEWVPEEFDPKAYVAQ